MKSKASNTPERLSKARQDKAMGIISAVLDGSVSSTTASRMAEELVTEAKSDKKSPLSKKRPPMATKKVMERVIKNGVQRGTLPPDAIKIPLKEDVPVQRALPGLAHKPFTQEELKAFQVFRDLNGIVYLRVGYGPAKGNTQFVVNKGFQVVLITMPPWTVGEGGLNLSAVAGASIMATARRLLTPLNDQVTISLKAIEMLQRIVADERITEMDTKKNAKPAKFASITAPAPKASAKTAVPAKAVAAKAVPAKAVAAKKVPAKAAAAESTGLRVTKSKFDGMKFKVNKEMAKSIREGSKYAEFVQHALSLKQPFTRDQALPDRASVSEKNKWNNEVTRFEMSVRSGLFEQAK